MSAEFIFKIEDGGGGRALGPNDIPAPGEFGHSKRPNAAHPIATGGGQAASEITDAIDDLTSAVEDLTDSIDSMPAEGAGGVPITGGRAGRRGPAPKGGGIGGLLKNLVGGAATGRTLGTSIAGGSISGAITSGLALSSLGPLGIAVAGVSAAFSMVSGVAKSFGRALGETTNKLAQFSPAISAAQARNQAAQTIQDINAAQRMGPALAAFAEERGQLSRSMSNIKNQLLETFAPVATGLLEGVNGILDFLGLSADEADKKEIDLFDFFMTKPWLWDERPGMANAEFSQDAVQGVRVDNTPPNLGLQ